MRLPAAATALALLLITVPGAAQQQSVDPVTGLTEKQAHALADALKDRVPGEQTDCIRLSTRVFSHPISERVVLYRKGTDTVWLMATQDSCHSLMRPGAKLVTTITSIDGARLCRGDRAVVIDLDHDLTLGACTIGSFTRYSKPKT